MHFSSSSSMLEAKGSCKLYVLFLYCTFFSFHILDKGNYRNYLEMWANVKILLLGYNKDTAGFGIAASNRTAQAANWWRRMVYEGIVAVRSIELYFIHLFFSTTLLLVFCQLQVENLYEFYVYNKKKMYKKMAANGIQTIYSTNNYLFIYL